MSEPPPPAPRAAPTTPPPAAEQRSLFQKLVDLVVPGPDSRDELIESLADAEQSELIEPESRVMLEGVLRMADMTAGDVMVAAPHMDLLDIDAPYDDLLHVVIGTGHSRFPVYEEQARQRHRHPDGQGPAQAAARARAQPAHAAAAGGLRAGVEGAQRAAARLPLQPQPPGDRHRRVRQHRRPDHDRGRARGDRRRDRGRVRRRRTAKSSIYTLADGTQRVAGDAADRAVNEAFDVAAADRRVRHHRRPRRPGARPRAAARRGGRRRRPGLRRDADARRRGALVQGRRAPPKRRSAPTARDAPRPSGRPRSRRPRRLLAGAGARRGRAQPGLRRTTAPGRCSSLAVAVLAWRVGAGDAAARGAGSASPSAAAGWCAGTWWLFISMHRYGGLPAPAGGAGGARR